MYKAILYINVVNVLSSLYIEEEQHPEGANPI